MFKILRKETVVSGYSCYAIEPEEYKTEKDAKAEILERCLNTNSKLKDFVVVDVISMEEEVRITWGNMKKD